MIDEKITIREAYLAMVEYLENLYKITGSEELAGFLGAMQLMKDDYPIDRAVWNDWVSAVQKVIKGK